MSEEFGRMRSAGIKVTRSLLQKAGIDFLSNPQHLGISAVQAEMLVTKYFMQDICMNTRIVVRPQSGHR